MLSKKDIMNIIKTGLTLCAITAVSALILAMVNDATAPVIAENNAKKQNAAMKLVMPDATSFNNENITLPEEKSIVTDIYEALDSENNCIGYAVTVSPNGYGGEISMVVGIDSDLVVKGIDIVTQSETAGLGSKCTTDEFKSQYAGKTSGISVVKSGAENNEVDAISGATVTSKAVTSGVNSALEAVSKLKGDN